MTALSAKCMCGADFSSYNRRIRLGRDAMLKTTMLAALMIAPLGALAQATYRCTTADGKKYYGSTIPMQCMGHRVEQLNSQGLVVRRIDPEGEQKERDEEEGSRPHQRKIRSGQEALHPAHPAAQVISR